MLLLVFGREGLLFGDLGRLCSPSNSRGTLGLCVGSFHRGADGNWETQEGWKAKAKLCKLLQAPGLASGACSFLKCSGAELCLTLSRAILSHYMINACLGTSAREARSGGGLDSPALI